MCIVVFLFGIFIIMFILKFIGEFIVEFVNLIVVGFEKKIFKRGELK